MAGSIRPGPIPAEPPEPAMPRQPALAVAVSGGLDSTALLHAVACQARTLGLEVHALHVHHGLLPEADAWLQGVKQQCRRWSAAGLPVHFHAMRLSGAPARGESVEAWARQHRYEALADMAQAAGCNLVLLAHHRRDQAETVLLQALRGGGPAGLAAMPRVARREGLTWARPWLEQPRERIEAYVKRWRLSVVVDPSNADLRLGRGRLRVSLWPALQAAFPEAEAALAQSARQAHRARELADEWAALDLAACVRDAGQLDQHRWCALSPARRANLLAAWLRRVAGRAMPDSLLQRLLDELPAARAARWPAPGGQLRLHRGELSYGADEVAPEATPPSCQLDLSQPGFHAVPGWGGGLRVQPAEDGGIPSAALREAVVRPREGGDRFQSHARGLPRALKKQFQQARVPEWERQGPVLETPHGLAWVAGLGCDARALAWPGSPRVSIHWDAVRSPCQPLGRRAVGRSTVQSAKDRR